MFHYTLDICSLVDTRFNSFTCSLFKLFLYFFLYRYNNNQRYRIIKRKVLIEYGYICYTRRAFRLHNIRLTVDLQSHQFEWKSNTNISPRKLWQIQPRYSVIKLCVLDYSTLFEQYIYSKGYRLYSMLTQKCWLLDLRYSWKRNHQRQWHRPSDGTNISGLYVAVLNTIKRYQ